MEDKIKSVLAAVFGIDQNEISDESSYETIASWDSLTHMNMISALEETFEVHFEDEEILEMINFRSVRETVQAKVSGLVMA